MHQQLVHLSVFASVVLLVRFTSGRCAVPQNLNGHRSFSIPEMRHEQNQTPRAAMF